MTWGEFIAKQIIYRIQYKYTRSDHKPSDDTKFEILKAANASINAYNFDQFSSIILHDLATDSEDTIVKSQLKDFPADQLAKPEGKFHVIKFEQPYSEPTSEEF